ncbi:MAG TPA: tetratricopeptide repeat protein [Vicinamibacteria bacterium]|nr:tetratricopeptide repeat protein [Vicinamibacteria bacterium]
MFERSRPPDALFAALLLSALLPCRALSESGADPAAALGRAIALAEESLHQGELEAAESHYRTALLEGWLLVGRLDTVDGRLPEAREAFRAASTSAAETGRALRALALAHLRLGETAAAVDVLVRLARQSPNDAEVRRLLAQVRAGGPPEPAVPAKDEPLAAVAPAHRLELERRAKGELVRAYLNLGVMQTQGQRFSRGAELFGQAAAIDPDSPQVQYALGVARFNARQFAGATGPLGRALAARPEDAGLRRMLAMAWLNAEAYDKAAELLRDDPEREADASLQFAYGLALVRTGRAAAAQPVFARLLARHGDSAQVRVVLGQASAQQGDFEAAIRELTRALQLDSHVAEANAALGVIYLKQGRLAEAEEALRTELRTSPDDVQSENALATVLDLLGRPEEALPLLRRALESKPDFADARYLLGKILLAQGAAPAALEHLEAAVRLAPDDANIHYQLARAYQALGRKEQAEEQFEVFRRLKDERRKSAP